MSAGGASPAHSSFRPPVLVPEAISAPTIEICQREATHVGSRYEGSVSVATGRREGQGTYNYPNSYFTYEGEWLDGKKHGRGRLSFGENNGYYEGEFKEGEILGQGSQQWSDGTTYTGQFVSGERHGQGTIERPDGSTYNGSWEFNKYSGKGERTFTNGDIYAGSFKTHKYHGKGILTQKTKNSRYEGFFEAGLFHGEGELQARGGAFVYSGQFKANSMSGQGKGTDTSSGIAYAGAWNADEPISRSATWDIGVPAETERAGESYLLFQNSEAFREEAADQLVPGAADAKAKAKAKPKAKPGKGEESPEPDEPTGPELELTAGQPLPEVVLRLLTSDEKPLPGESGRRWKVTMFRERRFPKQDDPAEMETLRREVRFGDLRKTFLDPLDPEPVDDPKAKAKAKADPKAKAKAGASPEPPEEDGEKTPEPEPYAGEASMDGALGEQGELIIGNSEAWLLPVHLVPLIYWLRIEDTTEGLSADSFCKALPPMEFPVRVNAASE